MAVLRHRPAFQAAWRNLGTLARQCSILPLLKAARRLCLAEQAGLNPPTPSAGSQLHTLPRRPSFPARDQCDQNLLEIILRLLEMFDQLFSR